MSNYTIKQVDWATHQQVLTAIRFEVFVDEQKVPVEEELDELDAVAHHFLVTSSDGDQVATGRLLDDGRIGRMAVRKVARGTGVGLQMLEAIIEYAKDKGITNLYLHAQTHAIGFYQKAGFVGHGDEFLDAGIPHIEMTRAV